jgi:ubiquinol-cytochrome c reductase cytochrome b subunit/menaquinol-cytochrome c reductase cytochrome b/c subunit
MRAWTIGCVLAVIAPAGCGSDKEHAAVSQPRTVIATAVPERPAVRDAPVARGREVLVRSGCLACHQLFTQGESGPGNNLTGIGARMSRTEILRAVVNPTSPMPSYRDLPSGDLDDLVAYLSALRSNTPGGPPCPGDVDCG